MIIDNINVPENLMKNVEHKLRNHVENKKKRLHAYAAAAAVSIAVMLPVSVYAYNKYYNNIPFKQEIDLARQNNNVAKLSKTFKYKNVEFNIKEVIADETGMEVIYDVSDSKYAIDSLSFGDVNNKWIGGWGYSLPESNLTQKEKAFYIVMDKDAINYMRNNPIAVKINKVSYKNGESNNKVLNKINSFIGVKNDSFKVDWNLKMLVPMQEVKVLPINKEYTLDIGTLKLKSLKEGVLKTIIEYDFAPSDKNIQYIDPIFSLRMDKEYTNNVDSMVNGVLPSYSNGKVFKSIYYKKINEIGIRLIGANVWYNSDDTKEYEVFKDKLPMEFDFKGDKFKIVSMIEKGNSIEYEVEYSKTNRTYNDINIVFGKGSGGPATNEKVEFKDKVLRDKIYNTLSKKVPDFKSIYNNADDLNIAETSTKIATHDKDARKFKIWSARRNFLYDTDEIVIKP